MTVSLLPYSPDRDVYRLLDVPPSASLEEIGAACRKLARTFHPDRNGSRRATQEMQVVNAVRRVMTDPQARATYDRERHRFHARRTHRPILDVYAVPHELAPLLIEARPTDVLARYTRAVGAGLRAAATELLPVRCSGCRLAVEPTDAYCAACGQRL